MDILRETPPDKVTFPPEPIYEEDVNNSMTQSGKDRKTQNEQLKNAWLNKFQKIEAAVILCGDKPCKFCDNKAVSPTYVRLGTEGRRIFGSEEPTVQIDQISTKDLWNSLDNVFTIQKILLAIKIQSLHKNNSR